MSAVPRVRGSAPVSSNCPGKMCGCVYPTLLSDIIVVDHQMIAPLVRSTLYNETVFPVIFQLSSSVRSVDNKSSPSVLRGRVHISTLHHATSVADICSTDFCSDMIDTRKYATSMRRLSAAYPMVLLWVLTCSPHPAFKDSAVHVPGYARQPYCFLMVLGPA